MAAVFVLAMGSCAYDPNYLTGGTYSASYEGGASYGEGHGYGGSGFSTSLFISTGNPRWGYDPNCYCYYDYHRRCYYDPYLYGYYPVGYRPMLVVGTPHPYGYNRSYCPPPTRVVNVTLSNYHNRESAYRSSNYGWAHQVRQQAPISRNQPLIEQRAAPYTHSTTANYASTHNPSQPPVGTFQPRYTSAPANPSTRYSTGQPAVNSAVRYPAGQPVNNNYQTGRVNPQAGVVQATDQRRGHVAPTSPGAQPPNTPGPLHQRLAPGAVTKGHGEGRGNKDGKPQADH